MNVTSAVDTPIENVDKANRVPFVDRFKKLGAQGRSERDQANNHFCSISDPKRDIAIVIPTLNEESGISEVLGSIHAKLNGYAYEVIVVDGRSKDETVQIAKDMGATVIYQARRGYGNALRTGMGYAVTNLNTKVIVFMDADRTYDPKDVPSLVKPILEGRADIVTGNRLVPKNKESMPQVNKIGNTIISLIMRASYGLNVKDACSGMKALRSDLVRRLRLEVEDWPLMTEILAKAWRFRVKIAEVPVSYHVRLGESKLPRLGSALDNIAIILKNRLARRA